jgi:hypothetical protein
LPYELALKAVTDRDPLVREWMARESPYIDYREARHKGADEQFTTAYLHPDRNLIERLRQAGIYSKCQSAYLRVTILESCLPEDKETLRLGRGDTDWTARYIAYGRSRYMDRQEIEDVLRREKDKVAIGALLENPWQGSIARELHDCNGDIQEQPFPAGGPGLIEAD